MNIIKSDDPSVLGVAMFDNHPVRITGSLEQPWFVLADVCEAIDLEGPRFVARKLADDEKGVLSLHTPGGMQQMTVVSEAGMYTLTLRCRQALTEGTPAYRFRRWVTNEVLPEIRRTGRYSPASEPEVKHIEPPKPMDMMPGDRFASLTVIREAEPDRFKHRRVVVKCDCGMEFTVRATEIRIGRSTQCIACSRKRLRLPAPPKTDAFLLETYQLAFTQAASGKDTAAVMEWCHQEMLNRASK